MPELDAHLVDARTLMPTQTWMPASATGADAHWKVDDYPMFKNA